MSALFVLLIGLTPAQDFGRFSSLDRTKPVATEVSGRLPDRPAVQRLGPCDARRGESILFCDDFEKPELSHADQHRPVVIDGADTVWFAHSGQWNSRAYVHGCELQYYTQYGLNYGDDGPEHYAAPEHDTNFVHDASAETLSLVLRREVGTTGYLPGWMSEPGGSCWMNWQDAGDHSVQEFDYTSGWLQTPMRFRYGRFEIRARIPNEGRVAWPAFWLFGGTSFDGGAAVHGETANEIDIFEFTGYDAHRYTRNLHNYYNYDDWLAMYGDPGDDASLEECTASHWSPTCNFHRDASANTMVVHHGYHNDLTVDVGDWHTYALEWTPTGLTWFLDGQQIGPSVTHDVPDNFMTLIVNNALPDWLSHGINQGVVNGEDTSLVTPAEFEMAYVKVTALNHAELVGDWTNGGTDLVDGWYLNANDHHLAGDFDGDGSSELLSLNATSGFANLMDHQTRHIDKSHAQWTYDNARWTTAWSNQGSGSVDWWSISDQDRFVVGDFVADARGADELLGLQRHSGYAHLMRFDGAWDTLWSNVGAGSVHWWTLSLDDRYVAGNFDGVGTDELLALSAGSGHAHTMRYGRGGWGTVAAVDSGALGSWIFHADDVYVAADLDGDGADELFVMNAGTQWAQILEFDGAAWRTIWSNEGSGAVHWWMLNAEDTCVAIDVDGSGRDALVAMNEQTGWTQVLRFNGVQFEQLWGNGGVGMVHDASAHLVGDFGAGGHEQLLQLSDRHFARLESFRQPSEVLHADQ